MTTTTEVKTVPIQFAEVPSLDHDAEMQRRFNVKVGPRGALERRIVWNLCLHLVANGWSPVQLNDGDEVTDLTSPKEAMELIFNLDDAYLTFKNKHGKEHWVRLVLGNELDIISDYSFNPKDNFDVIMRAFDTERCA